MEGGSPTVGNDADGGSSSAMNNRLWIWRGVSRGIKRKKEMEGWKNEGLCGSGCSRGKKKPEKRMKKKKDEERKKLGGSLAGLWELDGGKWRKKIR